MASFESRIYTGPCYEIEWGVDSRGTCQARDYYDALEEADRAKALALFKRMADIGKIYDTAKFTKETEKIYAFKPQPHRFFCFFVRRKRIIIVSAYRKQGRKMPARERDRAEALMAVWLSKETQRGQGKN